MNLFDKINAFEKLCNKLVVHGQDVVPLADQGPGMQLRQDPNTGKAYYETVVDAPQQQQQSVPRASLTGPSGVGRRPSPPSAAQNPPPARQRAVAPPAAPATPAAKKMPPEWLAKYMKLEQAKDWAEAEMQKMQASMQALVNAGPAVKPPSS